MDKQFKVRAFQIKKIETHGAICSDDWGYSNPMELHSDFGRWAVIPAEWFRALDPKLGSWVIEYPDGRLGFRTAEAFIKDYHPIDGQFYETNWQPLFSGKVFDKPVDRTGVLRYVRMAGGLEDEKAFSAYLDALTSIMMLPLTRDDIRQ